MDTLKRITITASLIATMGNSLATNNLSSFVSVPGGGMVEIVIWMTAFEGQTPGPCKNVAIVPVMANGNGSTPTSNEVNIEVHALIIEELPRINIVPGEVAKVTVRNLGSDPTLRSVELLASPEDALGICGLKASMSTFGPSGIYEILLPTGAPVSLDQNFKAGKGLKDAVN